MATDLIRYDLHVQDALRSVLRRVLSQAARDGLPGDHHFFISFRTGAPGVRLSNRMREQYPQEMTIILQHQFWDLVVGDLGFEVGLSFQGKPEILSIPFTAVTGFFDPSVDFGLKFEMDAEAAAHEHAHEQPEPSAAARAAPKSADTAEAAPRLGLAEKAGEKGKPRGSGSEPTEINPSPTPTEAAKSAPAKSSASARQPADEPKVVSIDAFRKKP